MRLAITRLDKETVQYINQFDCGNTAINNFLLNDSLTTYFERTHLLMDIDKKIVIGFFSLCTDVVIDHNDPEHPHIPAVRISMFAIDKEYQHKKDIKISGSKISYGHFMLTVTISIIERFAEDIGAVYIVLSATEEGRQLYKKRFHDLAEEDENYHLSKDDGYPMIRLIKHNEANSSQ